MKLLALGILMMLALPVELFSAPFSQEDFTPPNPLVVDVYQRKLDETIRVSQAREMRAEFQVYTYPFTREYVRLRFQKEVHARLLDKDAVARSMADINAFKPWDLSFLFPVFVENFQGHENPLYFNPEKIVLGFLSKGDAAGDWSWFKPELISGPPTYRVPGRSVFVFSLNLSTEEKVRMAEAGKLTLIVNDLAERPVTLDVSNWLSLDGLFDESDPQGERQRIGLPDKLGFMY